MSGALPWFRMYTEAIDDEKLGLLAFEDRWHFVALLCLKGRGVLDNQPDDEMLYRKAALKMGLSNSEFEKVVHRLSKMGLIHAKTLQPLAWEARQMQSDSSTDRVRAFRERMKHTKRTGNVSVTAQEEDTDTEEDKEDTSPTALPTIPPCPVEKILDLYAQHLPELSQPRRSLFKDSSSAVDLRSRWRWVLTERNESGPRAGERMASTPAEALEWFERFFGYVARSDFLTGRTASAKGKPFAADLQWLVGKRNFAKVVQGNYINREAA